MDRSRLSRRAWLRRAVAASGGAAVAALAGGLGPRRVAAADGDAIRAGQQTNAESSTVLYADGSSYGNGLLSVTDTPFGPSWPAAFPKDAGVTGFNAVGSTGVGGFGSALGVYGAASTGGTGVEGVGESMGVYGHSASGWGVYGVSQLGPGVVAVAGALANTGAALVAQSNGKGSAIRALTTSAATSPTITAASASAVPAVQATGKPVVANGTSVPLAGNAAALTVQGKASFTRSGIATIAAGKTSAAVQVPGGLSSSSHVLTTMQTKLATTPQVVAAVPNTSNGTITIYLSLAASAIVHVAWFVFG